MGMKMLPKLVLIGIVVSAIGFGTNYALKSGAVKLPVSAGASGSTGGGIDFGSTGTAPAAPAPTGNIAIGAGVASPAPVGAAGGTGTGPLRVSLVSFHGYAPALMANGNSLTTQPGSIYAKLGANIEFLLNDDVPTLSTLFESGHAQCAWRTSDSWAQEQPNLRNAHFDARAVMVVDNTQGGDAIISNNPDIRTVEDLAGKTVSFLQFTPSHGLLINALDNSSLSGKKRASVKLVQVNPDAGTAAVRAMYTQGKVDAAVLWDPDLSIALAGGGHVVYSTKQATNLIFDVMVCDQRVLATPEGAAKVQAFVTGWLQGVTAARADKANAVRALAATEPTFADLVNTKGAAFVAGLFANLVWTDLADNARILGLTPDGTNHYARVYTQFDGIYRAAGTLANPNSPVIDAQQSFDYRFVRALLDQNVAAVEKAQQPQAVFTQVGLDAAAAKPAALTKPVLVAFVPGSAELNQAAKRVIDTTMVPFIEDNGSAYFEVSGNTDSTGSTGVNRTLSLQRAKVVIDYLVKQWDMSPTRFKPIGNGPAKPLCNEQAPDDGVSLAECQATNRTTRLGLLAAR